MMRWRSPLILITATLCACSSGAEDEEMAQQTTTQQAAADTMAMAMAAYDPASFDTISWDDPAAAVERGATVFRFSCQKCHGPNGEGDAGFVMNGDTLRPQSFHAADWAFAEDRDALREQIYIGTLDGMPHWGLEGLKYRDVDAVALYIQAELLN
jgi:mono/diheme cytochrome c family protein